MADRAATSGPLLLVGCGKMGGALLGGWLEQGIAADQITVVEPAQDAERSAVPPGVTVLADGADLAAAFARVAGQPAGTA